MTVHEKRRVNEEQPTLASSPSRKSRQRGAQTTPAHLHWCRANPPSSWLAQAASRRQRSNRGSHFHYFPAITHIVKFHAERESKGAKTSVRCKCPSLRKDFPKDGTLDMPKGNFRNIEIFSFGHGQFYCKGSQELALKGENECMSCHNYYCGKAPTVKPQLSCVIRRPCLKVTIGRVRNNTRLSLSVTISSIPCIVLCLCLLCRIAKYNEVFSEIESVN